MNFKFELECSECGEFTHVLLEDDDVFPTKCPLCGGECEAELEELEL